MFRPTRSLLAILAPLALAPMAVAEDAPKTAFSFDHTFIAFGEKTVREHPPLTPSLLLGGSDERDLRYLHASGEVFTPLLSQEKPYRALDAYRQYAIYKDAGSPPTMAGWTADEWEEYGAKFEWSATSADGFDPAQRIRVRQYFVDGPVRFENQQGRTLFQGYNAFISDRAVLRTGAFLFTVEPELRLHNTTRSGYDPRFDARWGIDTAYSLEDRNGIELMEATAQVDLFGAHLTVGRQALSWGPARQQQLTLSANAAPMWMVHLTSSEPLAFPGQLSRLGFFTPELFVAQLEHDRPVPNLYLAGFRIGWQINDYVKIGGNMIRTLGGEGHSTSAGDWAYLFTSGKDGSAQDHKASADWRVFSPWQSLPFEFYGEIGWESRVATRDIFNGSTGFPLKHFAYVMGVYLPKLDDAGIWSATVEHANTNRRWYTTGNRLGAVSFPGVDTDYSYRGQQIGAAMGGDAVSYFAEARAKLGAGVEAFGSLNFEEHGQNAPVTETLLQAKIGVESNLGRSLGVLNGWHGEATIGWDRWRDFQGTVGRNEDGLALGVGLRRGF